MNRLPKQLIITIMALAWFFGCSLGSVDNSDNIDALKAHMINHDKTIRITPMAEAFAGLVSDPAQKQTLMAKAEEGYTKMDIKNIYLVTGATAETNETVIGTLIHFNKGLTLDEARALLEQDENYKGQTEGMILNGHFAFAIATVDGKRLTPKSVIAAFENFK